MSTRWTDLDLDEYRLPEGFRRIGYDADEGRYYFRDGDGKTWRSEPGNEYGVLTPVRPEPPVTIPRRPPPPQFRDVPPLPPDSRPDSSLPSPPPYSEEPVDDPPPRESTSVSKTFGDILTPGQITSAPSTPKRSNTINVPSVASLKRSSTIATSFIRSQGKRFTNSGRSGEGPDSSGQSTHTTNHRRIVSSPLNIRRATTAVPAETRGEKTPRVEPMETFHRRGRRDSTT